MTDVVYFAIVSAVVILGSVAAARVLNRSRDDARRWRLDEQSWDGKGVLVVCRRGREKIPIGDPVALNDPDFNSLIEERRCEAREKLAALNP